MKGIWEAGKLMKHGALSLEERREYIFVTYMACTWSGEMEAFNGTYAKTMVLCINHLVGSPL